MNILFDIGGTNIRFARTNDLKSFDTPIVKANPGKYEDVLVLIRQTIQEISRGEKIDNMVGGIAGVLDKTDNTLLNAPNLQDWIRKPIKDDLRRISGAKVMLFNDAEMAGLGEAMYGAGVGFDIVAYVTISTGIGGALIIEDRIAKNCFGFEPGHQILNYQTGETFEDLLGGKKLEQKYNKKPKDLPKELYHNELKDIATVGIHNVIQMWSPEVVVLGGSQMNDLSIDEIEDGLKKMNRIFPELPKVVCSKLKDQNGLFGAMAILKIAKNI